MGSPVGRFCSRASRVAPRGPRLQPWRQSGIPQKGAAFAVQLGCQETTIVAKSQRPLGETPSRPQTNGNWGNRDSPLRSQPAGPRPPEISNRGMKPPAGVAWPARVRKRVSQVAPPFFFKAMTSPPIPDSCTELLQQMISIDSVNRIDQGEAFSERRLAEHLEYLARHWHLDVQRLPIGGDAYNLLVSAPASNLAGDAAPWLLFDSHLDTVSVEGMTIDPFAATIKGDVIYGRGACDTKGSGAAMLWALKTLSGANQLAANVAILFSIDEEVSRTGVRAFLADQLPQLGWRPNAVIVGEPTELKMVIAHNGLVRWRIETRGKAAHSSEPSQGRSAISDMVRVITALETQYIAQLDASHPLTGRAQCSINLIAGGQQINVISDRCTISLDRRLVPGEDGASVLPAVERILQRLASEQPHLQATQSPARIESGLAPDLNHALAEAVGQVLVRQGLSPEPQGAKYGSHASSYAEAGIPAIVLGPGAIAQAHEQQEFLRLDQLHAAQRVYRALASAPLT